MRKLSVGARAKKKAPPARKRVARPAAPAPVPPAADDPVQVMLRAASFAARKHQGQTRADNRTPYFAHVARVTLILAHVFGCEDEEVPDGGLVARHD